MNINVLSLIEDALIGGRIVESAYIHNNSLIEQIYTDWQNNKHTDDTFKDFLIECLNTGQENCNSQTITTYKPITKTYDLYEYDEKYKEYKKIQNQIDDLKRAQSNILKELAESKNKALADISTYEIASNNYGKYLEFRVDIEEILKIDSGENK